jgi:hypothetical protein
MMRIDEVWEAAVETRMWEVAGALLELRVMNIVGGGRGQRRRGEATKAPPATVGHDGCGRWWLVGGGNTSDGAKLPERWDAWRYRVVHCSN